MSCPTEVHGCHSGVSPKQGLGMVWLFKLLYLCLFIYFHYLCDCYLSRSVFVRFNQYLIFFSFQFFSLSFFIFLFLIYSFFISFFPFIFFIFFFFIFSPFIHFPLFFALCRFMPPLSSVSLFPAQAMASSSIEVMGVGGGEVKVMLMDDSVAEDGEVDEELQTIITASTDDNGQMVTSVEGQQPANHGGDVRCRPWCLFVSAFAVVFFIICFSWCRFMPSSFSSLLPYASLLSSFSLLLHLFLYFHYLF